MPSSDRSREDTLVVPHLTSPSTNTLGRRRSHAVKNLQMILNECVTAYMRASILAYWRMLLRRGCRLKTVRQAWSQKARLLPTPTAETTAKAIPAGRAESTICTCRLHMRPWRRPNILDYALGPSVVFAFSSRSTAVDLHVLIRGRATARRLARSRSIRDGPHAGYRGSNRGRQPAVFRARSHPGISPDPAHLFFQPRRLYTPGLDWYVQPYLYCPPLFTTCLYALSRKYVQYVPTIGNSF